MPVRTTLAVLAVSLSLIANANAKAANDVPAVDVAGVAKAIEDNYFDPAQGKKIADALRADAAAHKFDALHDDRDLATALSDRLRPFDQHFRVHWSPVAPAASAQTNAPAPAGSPSAGAPPVDTDRLSNYGVRRVEVQPGNIGYIDLRQFADFEFGKPDQPGRQAIEAALQLVAGSDALIIDLRDNGGGSPAMVGYLASAFTPKGANIFNTFHAREGSMSEAPEESFAKPRLDVPLYVLTSARTGSAAESFAYTLKNAHRAILVGEATAGAANPGGDVDAGHGFSVFVSRASPISPITGRNWEGTGVQPDVAAIPAAAMQTAKALALEAVIKKTPADQSTDARWALEALHAETGAPATVAIDDFVGNYDVVVIARQDGRLSMHKGRRPAVLLLPLGDDVFSVAGEFQPPHPLRTRPTTQGDSARVDDLGRRFDALSARLAGDQGGNGFDVTRPCDSRLNTSPCRKG